MKSTGSVCMILCALLFPATMSAAILHVPSEFMTIQEAIDAALDGDMVLVADGVYRGDGNKNMDYLGKAIHVGSENGPILCTIDLEGDGFGFRFENGETGTSILSGFTIRNGFSPSGAGIQVSGASPLIDRCIIVGNIYSASGGGIMCRFEAAPTITDCVIAANTSCSGGGIAFFQSSGTVSFCTITGNDSCNMGGGIYCYGGHSAPMISNCLISGNEAETLGGGCYSSHGATPTIRNCVFQDNVAIVGGGIGVGWGQEGPTIGGDAGMGNTFIDNRAAIGSDIYLEELFDSPVTATYNHFAGYAWSSYYVSPASGCDLSGSVSDLNPITQDVYVSTRYGNDANDGLTPETAFYSVRYALSRVYGTEEHPLTVHVLAGEYSTAFEYDYCPFSLPDHVTLTGEGIESVDFSGNHRSPVFLAHYSIGSGISHLTIRDPSDDGAAFSLAASDITIKSCLFTACTACALVSDRSNLTIIESVFSDNQSVHWGGALNFSTGELTVTKCRFERNATDGEGGAVSVTECTAVLENCLFEDNRAGQGGAVYANLPYSPDQSRSPLRLENCEFTGNESPAGADLACIGKTNPKIEVINCLFHGIADSDYYVSPQKAFRFENCTSLGTPIFQDVYVAPAGDDTLDGLSRLTPFRTLNHALSRVIGTEQSPVTIHLEPGLYSASATSEQFPLPLIPHVLIQGSRYAPSILDAESQARLLIGMNDPDTHLADLVLTNGFTESGSPVSLTRSTVEFDFCRCENNVSTLGTGFLSAWDSTVGFENSLFSGNTSQGSSGVVTASQSTLTAGNCTFAANPRPEGQSVLMIDSESALTITHSILWDAVPIIESDGTVTADTCDIAGGYPGNAIMDADPVFVSGPLGACYLASTVAGQPQTSPCIDIGVSASEVCYTRGDESYCMNASTTVTSHHADTGMVDLGFHYPIHPPRVSIRMPDRMLLPGERFQIDLILDNHGPETYAGLPLFALLDVFGTFYFAPDWTEAAAWIQVDVGIGQSAIDLFDFTWPSGLGTMSGLRLYAALVTPDLSGLVGDWDVVMFGWTE